MNICFHKFPTLLSVLVILKVFKCSAQKESIGTMLEMFDAVERANSWCIKFYWAHGHHSENHSCSRLLFADCVCN